MGRKRNASVAAGRSGKGKAAAVAAAGRDEDTVRMIEVEERRDEGRNEQGEVPRSTVEEVPMAASEVFLGLARGFWLLILGIMGGAALGLSLSVLATPQYEAEARVIVFPEISSQKEDELFAGANSSPMEYTQVYADFVVSEAVVGKKVEPLGADLENLGAALRSEASTEGPMFKVIGSSSDPERASELANAAGEAVSSFSGGFSKKTGYRAELAAEARPRLEPEWPRPPLNVGVGAAAGLLVSAIVALAVYAPKRRAGAGRG